MAQNSPSVPSAPKKKLPILPIAGVVVVLAAFIYGAYAVGYRVTLHGFVPGIIKTDPGAAPVNYDLGSFTTNLSGDGGNDYIRVDVVLNMGAAAQKILAGETDVMQNTILNTLRTQTLASVNGDAGIITLKRLIEQNIDSLLGGKVVYNVYFTDFLVQPGG